MRPANLIFNSDKAFFEDAEGLIRFYRGERATEPGLQKPTTTDWASTFDPSTLAASALTALSVPSTVLVDGSIDGDEIDGYSINLVAGQTYLFSVRGTGADPLSDTFLYVLDDGLALLDFDDDGGDGVNSLITYTATYTGTHVIGVGAFPDSGATGTYTLDAFVDPGVDLVSDDFALAAPLAVNATTFGFIEAGPGPYGANFSEVDTFAITLEAGKFYTIEMAGGSDYNSVFFDLPPGELDPRIVLYNSDLIAVSNNDDIDFPDDLSARISFFAEKSGTYYLDAFSWSPWTGGYSITVNELDLSELSPLDSINWFSASNVPFDATGTAYVYFANPGESFGELADNGVDPLPSLGWNAFEIQQVMLALEQYEKILGVNYEITTDASQATFRLITTTSQLYGAYFYPQDPAFGDAQGIGAFNTLSGGWNFQQQQSLLQGGFAFGVILHEFGHAHGLAHPHDTGGGSDVLAGVTSAQGSYGIYDLNQGVYTVMSYNDAWDFHPDGPSPFTAAGVDNGWSGTLSAFDIAVLQQRYGVINPWATGNDAYVLRDLEDVGTFYETIWDTGGVDTISYSGNRAARIDLTAATLDYSPTGGGAISFVDDIHGGFTIANGVVIENASGGGGADVLIGNAAANTLTGNGGDDVMMGNAGADRLDGGLGFDAATYISAASGVTASLGSNRGTVGDAAGDRFNSIEKLEGSNFDDILSSGNGANTLSGLAGDDVLSGGNGDDVLDGGAGADDLDGGQHNDTLAGGEGDNTLYGRGGVDVLTAGAGNDFLDGGDGADTLNAGEGDNTLYGRSGIDALTSGSGEDFLDGGDGADTLSSGGGADTLYGRSGADVLNGGAGDDVLNGGDGGDTFVFADLGGVDCVADFRCGQDTIDLAGIDAIAGDGDDAFDWIGSGAFSGVAGELHVVRVGSSFFVEGDVDGDGVADFVIQTNTFVSESDFVL